MPPLLVHRHVLGQPRADGPDAVDARQQSHAPLRHRPRSPRVGAGRYRGDVAYDEGLAERIRSATIDEDGLRERKMFGGLAFLHDGNMAFGIVGDELMVRVGPGAWADALTLPYAREMDFTGRSMTGMVYVGVDGFAEDHDLRAWLDRGLAYAGSLPPK